jgi:hypothetical protein
VSREEADTVMRLALGRIFRLGSRPEQPGDGEQYEAARRAALGAADALGIDGTTYRPNVARDR